MALPLLQLPIHSIELPVSKKKIQFHPFVIKEEKSFLTSINTDDQEQVIKLFQILVKNCVIGDFDVNTLNVVDFFYLIIYIRMKSTSELLEGSLPCSHCKKTTQFEVNLEESLVINNPEGSSVTVQINKALALEIVPPSIAAFFTTEKSSIVDIIAHSIKTVIHEGKVYTDFTMEELHSNILEMLLKSEFDTIAQAMSELTKLTTEFKFLCLHCAKENEYKTDNIVNFF